MSAYGSVLSLAVASFDASHASISAATRMYRAVSGRFATESERHCRLSRWIGCKTGEAHDRTPQRGSAVAITQAIQVSGVGRDRTADTF